MRKHDVRVPRVFRLLHDESTEQVRERKGEKYINFELNPERTLRSRCIELEKK